MRLLSISCFFMIFSIASYSQNKAADINREMKTTLFYKELPRAYYVAVLPLAGCFACKAGLDAQVKKISQKDKIVIVYPSTRKIVQEKIKKENKINLSKVIYIFDDKFYQKFYDADAPKGYTLKVLK